jgi:P4 family phage/plasmid primase-like protien
MERLVARGWHVHPLKPRAKEPMTQHGFKDASADAEQVRRWHAQWPDCNWGVSTGASGLVVVDVDSDRGGDATIEALEVKLGTLPRNCVAKTGSGYHVYLRAPTGGDPVKSGSPGTGVDVKAHGGYVVAPPSTHPNGARYTWQQFDAAPMCPPSWWGHLPTVNDHASSEPAGPVEQSWFYVAAAHDGLIGAVLEGGKVACACPNRDAHRTDSDGTSSTVLWAPQEPWGMGHLHCSRGACSELEQADFRKMFSPEATAAADAACREGRAAFGWKRPLNRGDQVELVDRLIEAFAADDVRPVVVLGTLWRYDLQSGVWSAVKEGEEQEVLLAFNGEPLPPTKDGGRVRTLTVKRSLVDDVRRMAHRALSNDAFFANAPAGALFADGFVTVEGRGPSARLVRLPHGPEHGARFRLPHAFAPGVEPERFLGFLADALKGTSDPDGAIRCIREHLGACLVGLAARYKRALLLTGASNTGKSVLLDIARGIFPPEVVASVSPKDFGNSNERYKLVGARINVCAEVPSRYLGNVEELKTVLAGDAVSVKRLYLDTATATLTTGHMFACNGLPETSEVSAALENRFLLVAFNNVVRPEDQDPFLRERILRGESGEIASWALEGALELVRRGTYALPNVMREQLATWREASDPVAQFAGQWLDKEDGGRLSAGELYERFNTWARAGGFERVPNIVRFGKDLRRIFGDPIARQVNGNIRYRLRLKTSADDAAPHLRAVM